MRPEFREDRATQIACKLLELRGGTMSYMKLIKLMYLIEREALGFWGRSLTYDRFVSMTEGPVLSQTYDLIKLGKHPDTGSYWHQFIEPALDYSVTLLTNESPTSELSDATADLINAVFEEHGHLGRWELVKFTHTLPEWHDPEGSAIPIEYREILREYGRSEGEIAAAEQEIDAVGLADLAFG